MADHLRLDFDVDEGLAVVDTDNTADHLRHDHLPVTVLLKITSVRPVPQETVICEMLDYNGIAYLRNAEALKH